MRAVQHSGKVCFLFDNNSLENVLQLKQTHGLEFLISIRFNES